MVLLDKGFTMNKYKTEVSQTDLDILTHILAYSVIIMYYTPLEPNFTCAPDQAWKKMDGQNQSRPIETELEILLFVIYHLNRTSSFHCKCVSIKLFAIRLL